MHEELTSIRKRQTTTFLKRKNYKCQLIQGKIQDSCERMLTSSALRGMHLNENLAFSTWGIRKAEEALWFWGGSVSQSGLFGTPFGRTYENVSRVCSRLNYSTRASTYRCASKRTHKNTPSSVTVAVLEQKEKGVTTQCPSA